MSDLNLVIELDAVLDDGVVDGDIQVAASHGELFRKALRDLFDEVVEMDFFKLKGQFTCGDFSDV